MPRIKINDLPKDMKIRGGLRAGMDPQPSPAPATLGEFSIGGLGKRGIIIQNKEGIIIQN